VYRLRLNIVITIVPNKSIINDQPHQDAVLTLVLKTNSVPLHDVAKKLLAGQGEQAKILVLLHSVDIILEVVTAEGRIRGDVVDGHCITFKLCNLLSWLLANKLTEPTSLLRTADLLGPILISLKKKSMIYFSKST